MSNNRNRDIRFTIHCLGSCDGNKTPDRHASRAIAQVMMRLDVPNLTNLSKDREIVRSDIKFFVSGYELKTFSRLITQFPCLLLRNSADEYEYVYSAQPDIIINFDTSVIPRNPVMNVLNLKDFTGHLSLSLTRRMILITVLEIAKLEPLVNELEKFCTARWTEDRGVFALEFNLGKSDSNSKQQQSQLEIDGRKEKLMAFKNQGGINSIARSKQQLATSNLPATKILSLRGPKPSSATKNDVGLKRSVSESDLPSSQPEARKAKSPQ